MCAQSLLNVSHSGSLGVEVEPYKVGLGKVLHHSVLDFFICLSVANRASL